MSRGNNDRWRGKRRWQEDEQRAREIRDFYSQQGFECYSPFHSAHILRRDIPESVQPVRCQRVLFQDPDESSYDRDDRKKECSSSRKKDMGRKHQNHHIAKMSSSLTPEVEKPERPEIDLNKENSLDREDIFGFNNRRIIRFQQTPMFKQLLRSPMKRFLRMFQHRIDNKKDQVKPKELVVPIELDLNPALVMFEGYKYFLGVADHFKKELAPIQARAIFKISVYMQPFDDYCWELAIRHEEDLGNYDQAYTYARAAFIFNKSDTMAQKVIKLSEKAQRPIEEVRGIISNMSQGNHKSLHLNFKVLHELTKLEWTNQNFSTAAKLLNFLIRYQDNNNVPYLVDLAKLLQERGYPEKALDMLAENIYNRDIKLSGVYTMYLKLAEQLLPVHYLHNIIDAFAERVSINLGGEPRCRILFDIAQIFFRLGEEYKFKQCIYEVLKQAPANLKFKCYAFVNNLLGLHIPVARNSATICQLNRLRFIHKQEPILYEFVEWKYYLPYSLFFIFDGCLQARDLIQVSSDRWSYSGRLAAEILFMLRLQGEPAQMKKRWERAIMINPKSGEIWCEGGRIYCELKEYTKARFCFDAAMQLTPQFGDTFIEAYRLEVFMGNRKFAKRLKYKAMYAEPFYGNVWCYLKASAQKSSVSDIWKRVKKQVKITLYKYNCLYTEGGSVYRQLTALDCYNKLFEPKRQLSAMEREHLFYAYDQMDPQKI